MYKPHNFIILTKIKNNMTNFIISVIFFPLVGIIIYLFIFKVLFGVFVSVDKTHLTTDDILLEFNKEEVEKK